MKTTIHVENGRKDMGKAKDFKSFLEYLRSFGLLDRDKVPSECYRAWKIVKALSYDEFPSEDYYPCKQWEKRNG